MVCPEPGRTMLQRHHGIDADRLQGGKFPLTIARVLGIALLQHEIDTRDGISGHLNARRDGI